ncbi:MAG: hypothetical protein U5K81_01720 [Trueperaceae bacterium]|nr:hypothetical protein [Trueperaceae bacterium]
MFFKRRSKEDPRDAAWAALAQRLEMTRLPERAEEELRAELAVDTGRVAALHALRRPGQPELLMFEHARGRRRFRGEERRARVLLRDEEAVSGVAWRAFPRSHPLITSLQTSRSGGTLIETGDEDFDAQVGVLTREPEACRAQVTRPVRVALRRLLVGDEPAGDAADAASPSGGAPPAGNDASVTCGGRHLAWRARRELDPPFDELEWVAVRMLGLWAALVPDRA